MLKIKEKIELISLIVKTITGILGGSLVLESNHPYLTLFVLALGATANEVLEYIKKKDKIYYNED